MLGDMHCLPSDVINSTGFYRGLYVLIFMSASVIARYPFVGYL